MSTNLKCPLCDINDYIYKDNICTIFDDDSTLRLLFNRHGTDVTLSMMNHAYSKCMEIFKDKFMWCDTRIPKYKSHVSWRIQVKSDGKEEK